MPMTVKLVSQIVDTDSLFERRPNCGRNLITGLARMAGTPVGILVNNPMHKAGVLDDKAAIKARKFIDLCDAFHIPLVSSATRRVSWSARKSRSTAW